MVLKFLSRHSPGYKGLMSYLTKEGKAGEGKSPEVYLHNVRGDQPEQWVRQFYANEAQRQRTRKGQVYCYHGIMAFNSLDSEKITKEMLQDMTNKFIELRGKQGMYLSCIHHDRDHTHIHFLISGLEFRTGKSFWMKHSQLRDLKLELQQYQKEKYPTLVNSLPKHGVGKSYPSRKEYEAQLRNPKASVKQELYEKVSAIAGTSLSQEDFLGKLRDSGLHHYERGGRAYGITFEGKNYRFKTLGVELQFQELEVDKTEEQSALDEIRSIRESNKGEELSRSLGADSEPDQDPEQDDSPELVP